MTPAPPPEQPTGADGPEVPDQPAEQPAEQPEVALLTLRDGLPAVIDTEAGLAELCRRIAAGTGPVALDAERASGYRYSGRAYLLQLRREGSGSALLDPIAFDSLAPLAAALGDAEWILHAATQDLPCLAEIGLRPTTLFDTELAGRLLGYPRVGLATLVETLLGFRLKKEHSAADWSTRPLPQSWLEYAALDVEVLLELRVELLEQLVAAGKDGWAEQEFEHLLSFEPAVRVEAWRRTNGLHKVRGRRALGALRALWEARDEIARERDVSPGRIVPDSAIVAAAAAQPTERRELLATRGFHGRGAERYATRWLSALREATEMAEADLPARSPRAEGPPVARAWVDRDVVAAARLRLAREELSAVSEQVSVPAENLLTPDFLRRTLWTPPDTRDPGELLDQVVARLTSYGARSWQAALTAPVLVRAILQAEAEAEAQPDAAPDGPAQPPESASSPSSSEGSSDSAGSSEGSSESGR